MISAYVLLGRGDDRASCSRRTGQLAWWEWHVLLLAAFVLVASGARIQWHEERFADLYLDDTVSGSAS